MPACSSRCRPPYCSLLASSVESAAFPGSVGRCYTRPRWFRSGPPNGDIKQLRIPHLFPEKQASGILITGVLLSVLVVLAGVVSGCSNDSSSPTSTPLPAVASTPSPGVTATATTISEQSSSPTSPPTPTSASLPSPAPTPTLAPSPATADSLADVAFDYLVGLLDELGPRASATQQELEAAEYLAAQFESFGYSTHLQPFTIESVSKELSSMVVNAPNPEEFEVVPLLRSAAAEVSGPLASVGLATEDDIPEEGLDGMVVLAERGVITFEEKTNRLAEAGAAAVVIYNNREGDFQEVLLSPASIPVLAISRGDGRRIEAMLSAGSVTVRVTVETEVHDSRNVIAEKPGQTDRVLVLGGHYDTVPDISGANDNSSGTAVLLTVAQELAQESLPFSVRFIAFGSEELGLVGSRRYVASLSNAEIANILAMFNFDALGSGEFGILGTEQLTDVAEMRAATHEINVKVSPGIQGGDSDHSSFADAGIPVLMFFGDDFSRIHTPEDTLKFVSPKILGDAVALALALLNPRDLLSIPE